MDGLILTALYKLMTVEIYEFSVVFENIYRQDTMKILKMHACKCSELSSNALKICT